MNTTIPPEHLDDVERLSDYMQMHHELQRADVGIGLGSHDPTVPEVTVARTVILITRSTRSTPSPTPRHAEHDATDGGSDGGLFVSRGFGVNVGGCVLMIIVAVLAVCLVTGFRAGVPLGITSTLCSYTSRSTMC
jgi:hypothetical protein